jgi:MFS family permease
MSTLLLQLPEIRALNSLTPDGHLLFRTLTVRLFAYGFIAVVLALYLAQVGLDNHQIGVLLTGTLIGDAIISLWLTRVADRLGRRRMLMIGAGLMILAGMIFALTSNILLLTLAAVIGTISPSGKEVGPFLSIEHAALPHTMPDTYRTQVFAWYNLIGYIATAVGSLCGGALAGVLQRAGSTPLDSYRVVIIGYVLLGGVLAILFSRLSISVEVQRNYTQDGNDLPKTWMGLHRSRRVVLDLAGLFMIDAFAGGLVVQSLLAYWFHLRYGVDPATLGGIFFGANLFAGFSALAAARIAVRFGLINTMVWTHIPSNVLLMLVPLMPGLPLAVIVLLARFSISQMDVPTRQSYIVAVVDPDERSAAAGLTTIARTAAGALSPVVTGWLLNTALLSTPFFLAGGLKIAYDLALYSRFRALKPPEEQRAAARAGSVRG